MREGLGNAIDHLTYLIETLPQVRLAERLREIRDVLYAAQPSAPITAEDVRAAEHEWNVLNVLGRAPWYAKAADGSGKAAFVADYLNRRGER
jgi:hypothetical protein